MAATNTIEMVTKYRKFGLEDAGKKFSIRPMPNLHEPSNPVERVMSGFNKFGGFTYVNFIYALLNGEMTVLALGGRIFQSIKPEWMLLHSQNSLDLRISKIKEGDVEYYAFEDVTNTMKKENRLTTGENFREKVTAMYNGLPTLLEAVAEWKEDNGDREIIMPGYVGKRKLREFWK